MSTAQHDREIVHMPLILAAVIGILAGLTAFGVAAAAFVGAGVPTAFGLVVAIGVTVATSAKLRTVGPKPGARAQ